MTDYIKLIIPGEPTGKSRPKFNGQIGRAYTPAKTKSYEKMVKAMYLQAYGNACFPKDAALYLRVVAYLAAPKSDSLKTRMQKLIGAIRPTKRPDWDNIGKIVSDALNKTAYHDDAQIVDSLVRKFYSDNPRVEITIQYAGGTIHEQPNLSDPR